MNARMPVNVRWGVDFRGRVGRSKRIAREIREIAPEVVELQIEGDRGISELPAVLAEILQCHPRVEAAVGLFPTAAAAARRGYPVTFVWTVDGGKPFAHCIPEDAHAVLFVPDEDTIRLLPTVLGEFARSGAGELHLPNVNAVRALAAKGHVPVSRPEQIREASEAIERLSLALGGKRIVVQDYGLCRFLHRAFRSDAEGCVAFSSCHGGSRVAYVDWDGEVYPCDALPIRLGNLHETSFERIWRSSARLRIAEALRASPPDCGMCATYSGCVGGCGPSRGLAPAS